MNLGITHLRKKQEVNSKNKKNKYPFYSFFIIDNIKIWDFSR